MLQANEQLVVAALRAKAVADTSAGRLDELVRTTQHDPLTDTPNRALMVDRIETAIRPTAPERFAVASVLTD